MIVASRLWLAVDDNGQYGFHRTDRSGGSSVTSSALGQTNFNNVN